jgi:Serine dehydratase beta chain
MSRQGSFAYAATEADWNGAGQCLRFVQHRHWALQFPHGWTDACSGPFRRHIGARGSSRPHDPSPFRAIRLPGATGHGNGSYNAVLWGLEGEDPETVDTSSGPLRADEIKRTEQLRFNGTHTVVFDPENDLILYRRRSLPFHPNGMTFTAYSDGKVLAERTYYSIGGGFVLDEDDSGHLQLLPDPTPVPYRFGQATSCWTVAAKTT